MCAICRLNVVLKRHSSNNRILGLFGTGGRRNQTRSPLHRDRGQPSEPRSQVGYHPIYIEGEKWHYVLLSLKLQQMKNTDEKAKNIEAR